MGELFREVTLFLARYNLPIPHRVDPLLIALFGPNVVESQPELYYYSQHLIFFVGCIALSLVFKRTFLYSFLISFLPALALLLSGSKEVVPIAVQWLPLFVASSILLSRRIGLFSLVLFFVASVLWLATGGNFLFIGSLFALLAATFVERGNLSGLFSVSVLLCAIILGISYFLIPEYPIASYPGGARLIAMPPASWLEPPRVGPRFYPEVQIYQTIAADSLVMAKVVAVAVGGLAVMLSFLSASSLLVIIPLAGVFVVLIRLQAMVPPSLFTYAPFESFTRLLPGVALQRLPWELLSIVVLLLFLVAVTYARKEREILASLFVVVMGGAVVGKVFFDAKVFRTTEVGYELYLPEQENYSLVPKLASRFVVSTFGAWASDPLLVEKALSAPRLETSIERIVVSINTESSGNIADKDLATAWSTVELQGPDDFVEIHLSESILLQRLELKIPFGSIHFPLAFEVRGGMDSLSLLADFPVWHGPLRMSDAGLPYFGSQSEVEVALPSPVIVKTIRINLTARQSAQPWSIHELNLYGFEVP